MSSIRIGNARTLDKRLKSLRPFRHQRTRPAGGVATLIVRIGFGLLLGVLLYSAASSIAQADELQATPRTLQSLASIRAAAEEYVRINRDTNMPGNSTPLIAATELDARLQLNQCADALTAFTLNSAPIAARTTVGVRCASQAASNKSAAEWTVYVPVVIESEIDVLVLRNSLPRDAHVAADDVSMERRRVPGFGATYISNAALLRDQHLKRAVPANTAVTTDMLTRDLIVKRGQQVQLVFDSGRLTVHAPGLALADGGTADRIRVQNQTSLKVVEGVIESGNLVRVGL